VTVEAVQEAVKYAPLTLRFCTSFVAVGDCVFFSARRGFSRAP
jgi:hypothetical protein